MLVTGGAGFIGSHIVDACIERGYRTAVLDNLSTGKRKHVHAEAELLEGDIADERFVLDCVGRLKPDVVIHLAAQIDVQTSLKRPGFDASVNVVGTVNVLEACVRHGVRKLIYPSSAAVYGVPQRLPIDEEHPVAPISFYGISKHTPEHYLSVYADLYGLDYTVLRYANVYGIRQDPKGEGGVVSIFTEKLLRGETPVIFGDGLQTRDFIYVADVAAANLAALERGSRSVLNIGSNEATTVYALLERMCEAAGVELRMRHEPERKGDIRHSMLSNTRARAELGWEPIVPLREGLQRTIDYYRPYMGIG